MRQKYLIGNWKMHMLREDAIDFIFDIAEQVPESSVLKTIICPHYLLLRSIATRKGDYVGLGAQNMHYETEGPFTGEVSPVMLSNIGAEYVLIGHSERRTQFGETEDNINKKVMSAFANKLIPILCIGENALERDTDLTMNVIERQIYTAFRNVPAFLVTQTIVSYEPVWAIGTGQSASPEQVESVIKKVRACLAERYSQEVANSTSILYGGSVKPSNIESLNAIKDVDGFLVGQASLTSESFLEMTRLMTK